jgi:ribosomal protein L40E
MTFLRGLIRKTEPAGWACTWCGAYNNWQSTQCWKCGAGKP